MPLVSTVQVSCGPPAFRMWLERGIKEEECCTCTCWWFGQLSCTWGIGSGMSCQAKDGLRPLGIRLRCKAKNVWGA
jgi:hypothetical protein